jgi:hypothetical protein
MRRYRDERDAARVAREEEKRRADALAEAAESQVRRVGAERDRAVAALVDAGGRGASSPGGARAVAEAVAAAASAADERVRRLERDHTAQLRAARASAADREASCVAEAERTARRERERADRLERAASDTLQQLAAAERERAQLARAAARRAPKATKSPLRPRTARSPGARSPATPTKAFQALVSGNGENRDARRALVAKGRDEYHSLRRANGDLRSQRDGLVDEVSTLKKELAQTRLVLHGMEYYAAGHKTTAL